MPTLRIHLAPRRKFYNSVHYTLTQTYPAQDASGGDSAQLEFSSSATLGHRDSGVYRGILRKPDGSEQEVVCKIVKGDTMPLEVEAELYNTRLKDLQGTDVPRFFGLFTGIIEGFPIRIACILLEYCGPTMEGSFKDYDIPTRGKIIEALVRIHNAGVQHNDFDTYHVILDQSNSENLKVRIVDFGHADKHTCRRKMEIRPYEFAPWRGDFSCAELYNIAYYTDFWTPTRFSILGFNVSVFEAYDAKGLAEYVAPYFTLWPRDVLEKNAQDALQQFRDKYRDRAEFIEYPFDGLTSDWVPVSDSDSDSNSDSDSTDGQSESEESGEGSGETASASGSEDESDSDDASSIDKPDVTEPGGESNVKKVQDEVEKLQIVE